jgi:hypothetical protein
MTGLIAACRPTLWKFLAEKEVVYDGIFIDVPDAGDEFSVTINVSTVLNLRGLFVENVCLQM